MINSIITNGLPILIYRFHRFHRLRNFLIGMMSAEELLPVIEQRLQTTFREISGTDNQGGDYSDVQDLWNYMFNKSPKKRKKGKASSSSVTNNSTNGWYEKAFDYWENPENCPVSDGDAFNCLLTASL